MKILGLNGWTERGHDGGASLIVDGKLVFAVEEEKLIRKRYAYDQLPIKSIEECLKYAKITLDEIDGFYIGWDYDYLSKLLNRNFVEKNDISKQLFGSEKYATKIKYVGHHLAHGYSTFVPSGFDDALVLVIDGQGEIIGTSVYYANKKTRKMNLVYESRISLGYFYTAITKHIGFRSGEEGKTMGLAPYGMPRFVNQLANAINFDEKEGLQCLFEVEKSTKDEEKETLNKWSEILEKIIPKYNGRIREINEEIAPYADLASSAQKHLEDIMVQIVKKYAKEHNVRNVCISGGVGLNCPMNSLIEAQNFIDNVFIQPAANDGGVSLGAAIFGAIENGDSVTIEMIPYLGPEYTNNEVLQAIQSHKLEYQYYENIEQKVAELLANNKFVANFQGRLEYGPRALGNRSLLASPSTYENFVKMNTLKGRELWRPLAPIVLFEKQDKFFDSKVFSPHMTKNFMVKENKRDNLLAITHVDGTSRVQSVSEKYNPRLHKILTEYYKITSIPVLINTSFNVKGEPIVCTPDDAIESFLRLKFDYLCIGNYIVSAKE